MEEEEEEKKPNLEVILGLWVLVVVLVLVFSHCCCSVTTLVSLSFGIDVQKALLHPVTIFDMFVCSQSLCLGFWRIKDEQIKMVEEHEMEGGLMMVTDMCLVKKTKEEEDWDWIQMAFSSWSFPCFHFPY